MKPCTVIGFSFRTSFFLSGLFISIHFCVLHTPPAWGRGVETGSRVAPPTGSPVVISERIPAQPARQARRKGGVSLEDLEFKDPGFLDRHFEAKNYDYPYKHNIFKDYDRRELEDGDFDGDLKINCEDEDDDNDGYTDVMEIACGSDPLDPKSLPTQGFRPPPPPQVPENSQGPKWKSPVKTRSPKNEENANQVDRVDSAAIYFQGLFGFRRNRVGVMKIVKDDFEKLLLVHEGDTIQGIRPGILYDIDVIDVPRDFIRILERPSNRVLKFRLTKPEDDKQRPLNPMDEIKVVNSR